MIILREGEELRRRYPAKIQEMGKGTLYFTNRRVCFESDKHGYCFGVKLENIYNWGRDKHHLYITWYEPQTAGNWTLSDHRYEVKIEMGRKKFNGDPLKTFDVGASLYYAHKNFFKYGFAGAGLYGDMYNGKPKTYDHFRDLHMTWDEVKSRKHGLANHEVMRDLDNYSFKNEYIRICLGKENVKKLEFEKWTRGVLIWTEYTTPDYMEDKITKKPYCEEGEYDTLLFMDVFRDYFLTISYEKDKLGNDTHYPFFLVEGDGGKSETVKLLEEYETRLKRCKERLNMSIKDIETGETSPNKIWDGKGEMVKTAYKRLKLDFIHFPNFDGEYTEKQRIEHVTRTIKYNNRACQLMKERVGKLKNKRDWVSNMHDLTNAMQAKWKSGDDSDLENWRLEDEKYTFGGFTAKYEKYINDVEKQLLVETV